jgi:2-polyprenyl-3-methyl-5-hydroxy-6-metoxy-1,4-benzoquinol methylase
VKNIRLAKNILRATLSSYLDTQYWDKKFLLEKTSWGFEPADSAILARDLFLKHQVKDILIPGIGYGRNAKIFIENGMEVTGIEISQAAIDLAHTEVKSGLQIYHGSVTDMPFDHHQYDGIFCYALIHLLNMRQRAKFIRDCYAQIQVGRHMIFTAISAHASMFGTGKYLSKNRYTIANGLNVFFYDQDSIKKEFGKFGLVSFETIDESIKHMKDEPPLKCYYIVCKRC